MRLKITKLLIDFIVIAIVASVVISVALFAVGETVEHFTP